MNKASLQKLLYSTYQKADNANRMIRNYKETEKWAGSILSSGDDFQQFTIKAIPLLYKNKVLSQHPSYLLTPHYVLKSILNPVAMEVSEYGHSTTAETINTLVSQIGTVNTTEFIVETRLAYVKRPYISHIADNFSDMIENGLLEHNLEGISPALIVTMFSEEPETSEGDT